MLTAAQVVLRVVWRSLEAHSSSTSARKRERVCSGSTAVEHEHTGEGKV